ncbi:hypothetical protein O0I10_012314 [Lichtheimia ornata]|uniref:Carboxymuconolactone decarboxylase-like domain-containing protein n=1 Tax=Lichtheimia ornata TaxID=688661 RepID=A0AAD7URA9_9FUNG|nr:uncharacterized protein O0I10_012314 [Lichtheimia ornata]KAJ8652083.1 hypothetical protein O0I10_012314 [Lichtheimia ornata]
MSLAKPLAKIQALYTPSNGSITNQIWYVLAAVVMTSLNRSQDIPQVYEAVEKTVYADDKDKQDTEKSKVLLRMREGIFKSFVIIGYPKIINSLQALNTGVSTQVLSKMPSTPIRTESSWNDIIKQRERGQHLFDTIYERHSKKVQENMYTAYPDLGQAAIHQLYGPVLAESSVISAKETSLIMVAGLMLQDVPAQLKGHRYGALHHGATQQDLERLEIMVDIIARHYNV